VVGRVKVKWVAPVVLAAILFFAAWLVLSPASLVNAAFLGALCLVVAIGFVALASPNPADRYKWPDGRPSN
jgi:hypothetical protein